MDSGLLNVLHDRSEEKFLAVVQGVDVDLGCGIEETINEQRAAFEELINIGPVKIVGQGRSVINDRHALSAQNEARAHEDRETNPFCDFVDLRHRMSDIVRRRGASGLVEDLAELLTVFS